MMKNNSINLEQKINIADEDEKALQFIEEVTTNADQVQKQVLSEILTANANVEYLQRYGLHGHTDHETFKKVIPLIEYDDIQSDINRIANGDTSPILCQQPISEFFPSSGTSGGESKLILKTRAATTGFFKSLMSKDSCLFNPNNHYTSPYETIVCEDSYQSMYSQLLCGLLQKNQVLRLGCAFASTFIQVIRFLENNWKLLCNDIRTGTIDTQITDPYVRESVLKILGPAPKLADVIESECVKDSWEGVISRLWPNAKYIDTVVTGSMSQYIPILDYYSNGLPIVTMLYASSECLFGLNLNPLCKPNEISYTIIPTMAYFEFLPIERNNYPHEQKPHRQQELVDLVDVKLGQEYEIVITTYAGLYRYRVGDVVRVAGFKNKTPQFNFLCRKNSILSIDNEATYEQEMQNAVNDSIDHILRPFDVTLVDYTTYADISTTPGHYVLYWELRSGNSSYAKTTSIFPSGLEECCIEIEQSLNSVYCFYRSSGSIGPLEIKVVESGSFDKLMGYAISRGASASQYKTPRCLKFGPVLELINSRVISNHFSTTCPKFNPGHKNGIILKSS